MDTSHTVVTRTTTRENLYVAMTRGRDSNRIYVATDRPDDTHDAPHPSDDLDRTGCDVLRSVLTNSGAELSAHQTIDAEAEVWGNITQLGAEYETLAAAALEDRWATLIRNTLPEPQAEQVLASEAFGPLAAELHRATIAGWNPETQFPRLIAARPLTGADDPAAVIHTRLTKLVDHMETQPNRRQANYFLGMFPEVTGITSPAMRQALDERKTAMRTRAVELLRQAVNSQAAWLESLGPRPTDQAGATRWNRAALAIAAYRDRYEVESSTLFGEPSSLVQGRDMTRLGRMLTATNSATQSSPVQAGSLSQVDHGVSM